MSINQSYLSGPQYGYSMVVATTQQSINSTMKAYLSTLSQPLLEICYVADENGVAKQIPFDELLLNAKGSNPFNVPADANPNTNQDLLNLRAARFMAGFRARIGIPSNIEPAAIPDIVKFNFSNNTMVTFSLMCSEFTLAYLRPGGDYAPATWLLESQPLDNPWIFEAQVNLLQFTVGSAQYNELPPDVRAAISQYGDNTFSVQQLLFNLDQASLQRSPKFQNVEPGSVLDDVLNRYFLRIYFDQLQQDGSPVLGCTVTRNGHDKSPLTVTDVQMQVGPYVDNAGQAIQNPTAEQQNLATLNYLCAVDDADRRPPTLFTWNWLAPAEETDGVVALNRNVFARYIKDQIYRYAIRCCFKPHVRVWSETTWYGETTVWYEWGLSGNQTPTTTLPEQNATVLQMKFSDEAADEAGASGFWGRMELNPMYDLEVRFSGNTIVVKQHLKIYCYVRFLQSRAGGNVVDITVTNTYTLSVDANGNLTAVRTDERVDNSERPKENGFLNFFADVNSLSDDVKNWASAIADAAFNDLPLSVVRSFIFPGGNSFVFKDVLFSDNQDMVARVTYADPAKRTDPLKRLNLSKLGRSRNRTTRMVATAAQVRELQHA